MRAAISNPIHRPRTMPILLAGFALVCLGATTAHAELWNDADRAAVQHIKTTTPPHETRTADFSNPHVFRFIKRQYELAGFSEERYPGLHQTFQTMRQLHLAGEIHRPTETAVGSDFLATDILTTMLGFYQVPQSHQVTGAPTYHASGAASIDVGKDPNTHLSFLSLCFFDKNHQPLGSCASSSSFTSHVFQTLAHKVATPDEEVTASFAATYVTNEASLTTGRRFVTQFAVVSLDDLDFPAEVSITDPLIKNPDNPATLVCISRRVQGTVVGLGKCDYGIIGTANTELLLSVSGSMTYKQTQKPRLDKNGLPTGTGNLKIINTTAGGGCVLIPKESGASFFNKEFVRYDPGTRVLSWNYSKLDFGDANKVACGKSGSDLQFVLTLTTHDAVANQDVVASQISKKGVTTPRSTAPGVQDIPMLQLQSGCLHPEALIELDDGRQVAIRELRADGERVLGMGGHGLAVVGTVSGEETRLIRIVDAEGHELRLSLEHPVLMADGGVKLARELTVGDRVSTRDGALELVEVDEIPYDGPVHNLIVKGPDPTGNAPLGTFYANGFLVGDNRMQQDVVKERRRRPETVRGQLPAGFEQDYASHLEDRSRVSNPH